MTEILRLSHISAVYGRKIRALVDVSLSIRSGEIVTLIGNNGAGKTTLLKVISGLMPIEGGAFEYFGHDISGKPSYEIARAGIAHVPEGRRIFSRLTVTENLELGGYFRRDHEKKSDFERVFTLFPVLQARRNQLGGTLSGGEQQMLAIARALMARPSLLMLDEPSMGLAPVIVDKIFETLGEINKSGTTLFFVEQNAMRALKFAHRGYLLETGRIVLEDSAEQLFANENVRKTYLGMEDAVSSSETL